MMVPRQHRAVSDRAYQARENRDGGSVRCALGEVSGIAGSRRMDRPGGLASRASSGTAATYRRARTMRDLSRTGTPTIGQPPVAAIEPAAREGLPAPEAWVTARWEEQLPSLIR